MMTPIEQFDQIIRLQLALDSVTKVGSRRQMKSSDIQALIESLKHIAKTEKDS